MLLLDIGLMLFGAPILLAVSSCGFTIFPLATGAGLGAVCVDPGTCLRSLVRGFDELWSIPGVFLIDGDSAWGLNTGILLVIGGGAPSWAWPSGSMVAARAEKNPTPWGGILGASLPSGGLEPRLGDPGTEVAPFLLGCTKMRPVTGCRGFVASCGVLAPWIAAAALTNRERGV